MLVIFAYTNQNIRRHLYILQPLLLIRHDRYDMTNLAVSQGRQVWADMPLHIATRSDSTHSLGQMRMKGFHCRVENFPVTESLISTPRQMQSHLE